MSSYTYNRYLWLFNKLLHRRLSFEELQNSWEKSSLYEGKPLNLRTFHKHRVAVEDLFHVKIDCDSSDNYRYYINDSDTALGDRSRKWLLNSFNVADLVRQGQSMQDRILLEDIPEGTEYLSTVIGAMQKNKELEVSYQAFYEDVPSAYHVRPYCMKVHRQRWYILGFLKEQGALRHLALDRVKSMVLTDAGFSYPKDFCPEDFYDGAVGIWVNAGIQPEKVRLRAYGIQAQYLKSLPLHSSQKEVEKTGEYTDFRYRVCVTPDLIAALRELGDAVEVLEPASLRDEMRAAAKAMLDRYEK